MLIAFFVNDMAKEHPRYTTTMLAHEAVRRGHRVCYITPGDFVLTPDHILRIHARFAPEQKGRSFVDFFKVMEAVADKTETIDISEVDGPMPRIAPTPTTQQHHRET